MKKPVGKVKADFWLRNEGSIFILYPWTQSAKDWVNEHIPEDAQYFGDGVVVEPRYVSNIIAGIEGDGLSIL